MSPTTTPTIEWVVLTQGDRAAALAAALDSLRPAPVMVVANSSSPPDGLPADVTVLVAGENLGVPGGRDLGARASAADTIGFLDDDAVASPGVGDAIRDAFAGDARLGAVALRLVDEDGQTARRHVPRLGGRHPEVGGDVALFLGGACAVRRDAYLQAGGYWSELVYGHEEVELAWRLVDHGWRIRYLPTATVFHPRTEIGRHAEGWAMTGRNRVRIARRTLPWAVALTHATAWLLIGARRAPAGAGRRAYLAGWRRGWREPVSRAPIRWSTVLRLTRLGRPPVL